MRRLLPVYIATFWLLVLSALNAHCQTGFTSVTGQILDPVGNKYARCTITANFVDAVGATKPATLNGFGIPSRTIAGSCDSNANIIGLTIYDSAVVQPAGSTWQFTVCSTQQTVSSPSTVGQPQNPCFSYTAPICPTSGCITGATINIGTALQAAAPAIGVPINPLSPTGIFVAPNGVDFTGVNDSCTAMNNATSGLLPGGKLSLQSGNLRFGCTVNIPAGVWLDFGLGTVTCLGLPKCLQPTGNNVKITGKGQGANGTQFVNATFGAGIPTPNTSPTITPTIASTAGLIQYSSGLASCPTGPQLIVFQGGGATTNAWGQIVINAATPSGNLGIVVWSPGAGYTSAPLTANVPACGTPNASVTAGTITAGAITFLGTVGGINTGYTTAACVATTGGHGVGATVSYTAIAGVVQNPVTICALGSAYVAGDNLTITGGGANATIPVNSVNGAGKLASITALYTYVDALSNTVGNTGRSPVAQVINFNALNGANFNTFTTRNSATSTACNSSNDCDTLWQVSKCDPNENCNPFIMVNTPALVAVQGGQVGVPIAANGSNTIVDNGALFNKPVEAPIANTTGGSIIFAQNVTDLYLDGFTISNTGTPRSTGSTGINLIGTKRTVIDKKVQVLNMDSGIVISGASAGQVNVACDNLIFGSESSNNVLGVSWEAMTCAGVDNQLITNNDTIGEITSGCAGCNHISPKQHTIASMPAGHATNTNSNIDAGVFQATVGDNNVSSIVGSPVFDNSSGTFQANAIATDCTGMLCNPTQLADQIETQGTLFNPIYLGYKSDSGTQGVGFGAASFQYFHRLLHKTDTPADTVNTLFQAGTITFATNNGSSTLTLGNVTQNTPVAGQTTYNFSAVTGVSPAVGALWATSGFTGGNTNNNVTNTTVLAVSVTSGSFTISSHPFGLNNLQGSPAPSSPVSNYPAVGGTVSCPSSCKAFDMSNGAVMTLSTITGTLSGINYAFTSIVGPAPGPDDSILITGYTNSIGSNPDVATIMYVTFTSGSFVIANATGGVNCTFPAGGACAGTATFNQGFSATASSTPTGAPPHTVVGSGSLTAFGVAFDSEQDINLYPAHDTFNNANSYQVILTPTITNANVPAYMTVVGSNISGGNVTYYFTSLSGVLINGQCFIISGFVVSGNNPPLSCITSFTTGVTNVVKSTSTLVAGTGYAASTTNQCVNTTGGTGTLATISYTTNAAGNITNAWICNPGQNYTVNDVLTITGGGANASLTVTAVSTGGNFTVGKTSQATNEGVVGSGIAFNVAPQLTVQRVTGALFKVFGPPNCLTGYDWIAIGQ